MFAVALIPIVHFTRSGSPHLFDVAQGVDPLIGSSKMPAGYGRTLPLVEPPFAMTGWIPQTRQNRLAVLSYEWHDSSIIGFMGTHQPAMWMGDFGYVTLVPQVGSELRTSPIARGMAFDHKDEESHPDVYRVTMKAGDGQKLHAEMTATAHSSLPNLTVSCEGDSARAG